VTDLCHKGHGGSCSCQHSEGPGEGLLGLLCDSGERGGGVCSPLLRRVAEGRAARAGGRSTPGLAPSPPPARGRRGEEGKEAETCETLRMWLLTRNMFWWSAP